MLRFTVKYRSHLSSKRLLFAADRHHYRKPQLFKKTPSIQFGGAQIQLIHLQHNSYKNIEEE